MTQQFKENRIDNAIPGLSYTLLLDGLPICSGGIYPLWDGVAEGWVISSKRIFKNRIKSARLIKTRTDILCAANKIWRLQTAVKANFNTGIRFAEFLDLKTKELCELTDQINQIIFNGENIFMSFIGNFAAAQSAKAIGKYNERSVYQQAQLATKKAEVEKKFIIKLIVQDY